MAQNECYVAGTIALIDGKWKPSILLHLIGGPVHFNQLLRQLPGISQRMLTLQLRALEVDNLILRQSGEGNPPKINYSLDERGRSLVSALAPLSQWGMANLQRAERPIRQRKPVQSGKVDRIGKAAGIA